MSEVASLLQAAREAHTRYRNASGRIGNDGKVSQSPKLTVCGRAIQEALTARTEAHVLDPQHTDPAWLEDQQAMKGQTHDALVAFYVAYLAPEARQDCSAA